MRLQKFLSGAGVASRRAAERLISSGRVRVNGQTVTELGVRVDPDTDAVDVDGRPVRLPSRTWIALNKPAGYVTTRRDPQRRPTVYDLLPPEHRRLFHVGRLDADSEGLLLLTNDGDVANLLMHPRYEIDRVYEVEVEGDVATAALRQLTAGVRLEDGLARAQAIRRLRTGGPESTRLRLTIREGRKREVRRMFESVGHPVMRLVRVRFGPIRLGRLEAGRWRELGQAEVAELEAIDGER